MAGEHRAGVWRIATAGESRIAVVGEGHGGRIAGGPVVTDVHALIGVVRPELRATHKAAIASRCCRSTGRAGCRARQSANGAGVVDRVDGARDAAKVRGLAHVAMLRGVARCAEWQQRKAQIGAVGRRAGLALNAGIRAAIALDGGVRVVDETRGIGMHGAPRTPNCGNSVRITSAWPALLSKPSSRM